MSGAYQSHQTFARGENDFHRPEMASLFQTVSICLLGFRWTRMSKWIKGLKPRQSRAAQFCRARQSRSCCYLCGLLFFCRAQEGHGRHLLPPLPTSELQHHAGRDSIALCFQMQFAWLQALYSCNTCALKSYYLEEEVMTLLQCCRGSIFSSGFPDRASRTGKSKNNLTCCLTQASPCPIEHVRERFLVQLKSCLRSSWWHLGHLHNLRSNFHSQRRLLTDFTAKLSDPD